jgi:hypothetical protein
MLTGRYVGSLVSTVDLLENYPDAPSVGSASLIALRRQAEILVQKLSPGYFPHRQR